MQMVLNRAKHEINERRETASDCPLLNTFKQRSRTKYRNTKQCHISLYYQKSQLLFNIYNF